MRFHVGLAEATGSAALVRAMTGVQGEMTDLIPMISHPPEVLALLQRAAPPARSAPCASATSRARCG